MIRRLALVLACVCLVVVGWVPLAAGVAGAVGSVAGVFTAAGQAIPR